MNFKHATSFMMVGAVLGYLPDIFPGWCPATGVDGSSAGALWLNLMGTVQIAIAMSYFARRVLGSIAMLMEYAPAAASAGLELPTQIQPEFLVTDVSVAMPRIQPSAILPLPVSFEAGLLEPRRAA